MRFPGYTFAVERLQKITNLKLDTNNALLTENNEDLVAIETVLSAIKDKIADIQTALNELSDSVANIEQDVEDIKAAA